jgi:hypothetical protein
MATKIQPDMTASAAKPLPSQWLNAGQTEATLAVQKEVLDACVEAGNAWLARVKSEADLWSQLATKVMTTHSMPEALGAFQEWGVQRAQMAAEDGRRFSEDTQKFMAAVARSLSNGWSSGRTT